MSPAKREGAMESNVTERSFPTFYRAASLDTGVGMIVKP
jgi:hypothetical protein